MRFFAGVLFLVFLVAGEVSAQRPIARGTAGQRAFPPGNSCTVIFVEGPEARLVSPIWRAERLRRINEIDPTVYIEVKTSPAEPGTRCIRRKMERLTFVDLESGTPALDLALEHFSIDLADGIGMRSWPGGRVSVGLAEFKASLAGSRYAVEVHYEGGASQRLEQGGPDREVVWTGELTSRVR